MYRRVVQRTIPLGLQVSRQSRRLASTFKPQCLNTTCSSMSCSRRKQSGQAQHKPLPQDDVPEMEACRLQPNRKQLEVTFSDGEVCHFPYVWMRDNCQCEKCYSKSAYARIVLLRQFSVDIEPTKAEIHDGGNSVVVTWPDGHKSVYENQWLHERAFNERAQTKRNEIYGRPYEKWGAEIKDKLKIFDYNELLEDNDVLLEYLTQLERYGITRCKNAFAPNSSGILAKRVGMVRPTNYGYYFQVIDKQEASDLAFTRLPLGLHTDMPWYANIPSIQSLHCVKNASEGGESQFADAANAADQLKKIRPDLYKIMSEVRIDFLDKSMDYVSAHYISRQPVIKHNFDGHVTGFAFSSQHRDSFMNVPLDKVYPLYEGFKLLDDIMTSKENLLEYQMSSGDITTFDNTNVLHARKAYKGFRHVIGSYIEWCDVRSTIRQLREGGELRWGEGFQRHM